MIEALLAPMLALGLSGSLSFVAYFAARRTARGSRVAPADTVEERLRMVARTMNDSVQVLVEVQEEISVRTKVVEELQRDADTAQRTAALNAETRDAVRQVFADELASERRRSSRSAMLVNLLFFIAGVAASVAVTLFIGPLGT